MSNGSRAPQVFWERWRLPAHWYVAPQPSSTAAEPIKIGLVLPQSGPLSVVGSKIKQGFDAAQAMLGPITDR